MFSDDYWQVLHECMWFHSGRLLLMDRMIWQGRDGPMVRMNLLEEEKIVPAVGRKLPSQEGANSSLNQSWLNGCARCGKWSTWIGDRMVARRCRIPSVTEMSHPRNRNVAAKRSKMDQATASRATLSHPPRNFFLFFLYRKSTTIGESDGFRMSPASTSVSLAPDGFFR